MNSHCINAAAHAYMVYHVLLFGVLTFFSNRRSFPASFLCTHRGISTRGAFICIRSCHSITFVSTVWGGRAAIQYTIIGRVS